MSRPHSAPFRVSRRSSVGHLSLGRAVDLVVGTILLTLALPVMGVLALAVRHGSNGPVLHRQRTVSRRGRSIELLSFRTSLDGASTVAHARLRDVVGAHGALPLTAIGRLMRATRTDRLPRLFNVVVGDATLFSRH